MEDSQQYQIILNALNKILTDGGDGNFVIYHLKVPEAYYIQIAAGKGSTRLWVEACTTEQVDDSQREVLKTLGWTPPNQGGMYNFFKEFNDVSAKHYEDISAFILRSFREVYNLQAETEIVPEIVLQ